MNFLRSILKKNEKDFQPGGKLRRLFPLYEALDSFLFSTDERTRSAPHVRDFLDFKRMMIMVVVAMVPAVIMAFYNTGLQANLAIAKAGAEAIPKDFHYTILRLLKIGFNPANPLDNFLHGAVYFLPVYIVSLAAGGLWEVLFAVVRKHPINEGFLVTSLLFPMILPPTIPLWQTALGISFGVVFAKEVFGGVGMNIWNPALAGRAFLFFAYPANISGDSVWIAVNGISSATPLAQAAEKGVHLSVSWFDSFIGTIPGSMGETSTLACLIGAFILILTGIGSWRIMASIVAGMTVTALLFNLTGSTTNPMFGLSPLWHFVLGGFAFGTVFMATDPVSAAMTRKGKYFYGLLIGVVVVLIRVVNPAYPEGMMLAILFGNTFAPIIDHYVVKSGIKKGALQYGS